MSYEITLDFLPQGYALNAAKSGDKVKFATREFVSSEDGDLLISRLEGWPDTVLSKLPNSSGIRPSRLEHMLVVMRPDKSAIVYVNDDFEPLCPGYNGKRVYSVEKQLGQYLAYLLFQHLFKIPESTWTEILKQKWFPFIHLRQHTIRELINHAQAGFPLDEKLDRIADELAQDIPKFMALIEKNAFVQPHLEIVRQAKDRFLAQDYISTTSILFPRIEGIMRGFHLAKNPSEKASQGSMVKSVIDNGEPAHLPFSLALPQKFRSYLMEIYFGGFDPANPQGLSRHTVSHGVAPTKEFSKKGAVLAILILLQLSCYLRAPPLATQPPGPVPSP